MVTIYSGVSYFGDNLDFEEAGPKSCILTFVVGAPVKPPSCLTQWAFIFLTLLLKKNYFNLAALGLSCYTHDLRSSLCHARSLIASSELLLQHMGSSSLTRDRT